MTVVHHPSNRFNCLDCNKVHIVRELKRVGLVEGSELFMWAFNQMCNGVQNMSHSDWIAYKIESDELTREKIYADCN